MPMPFHEWLRDHRGGVATDEWAEELAKLMEAVRATGRKGKLAITIEVSPKGRSYVVTDTYEGKLPKFDAEAAVYFLDDSGSLVRHDPAQQQFDMGDGRTVSKSTGEIGGND